MLVFYPTACTVVNYSNTFEFNVVQHHLFTSWVSNSAEQFMQLPDHFEGKRSRADLAGLGARNFSFRVEPVVLGWQTARGPHLQKF
jgi:hypothetical protein